MGPVSLFVGGPGHGHARCSFSHLDDAEFAGEDLRDFTVGGLHWRQPEPLRVAEGRLRREERWRNEHRHSRGADAVGALRGHPRNRSAGTTMPTAARTGWPTTATSSRGLTRGVLTLGERRVEFTGAGHRDHSWGKPQLEHAAALEVE